MLSFQIIQQTLILTKFIVFNHVWYSWCIQIHCEHFWNIFNVAFWDDPSDLLILPLLISVYDICFTYWLCNVANPSNCLQVIWYLYRIRKMYLLPLKYICINDIFFKTVSCELISNLTYICVDFGQFVSLHLIN